MDTDKLMRELFTGKYTIGTFSQATGRASSVPDSQSDAQDDGDWLSHHRHHHPSATCHLCKGRTDSQFVAPMEAETAQSGEVGRESPVTVSSDSHTGERERPIALHSAEMPTASKPLSEEEQLRDDLESYPFSTEDTEERWR
jgi:hypothetical protein